MCLDSKYLYVEVTRKESRAMTRTEATLHRPTESTTTDLADSLDIRLIVAGRLSPTAVDIRRERAELAAVLAPAPWTAAGRSGDRDPEPNLR
jgi:hypothetical protein